jgi:hypothetical protein
MKGRSALNHAVLVVGNVSQPHLFHWSYRANAFVDGAYGPPPLYCRPRHNYFDSLDQSAEHDDRALFIAYGGRQFLIPRAYQPHLTWPGMHMLITAKAPDFEPTNGRMQEGNLATMVSIHFKSTSMLESWRDRSTDSHKIESLGNVYGLTKERITRSYSSDPGLQYYQLHSDGTVAILIKCVSQTPEFQCEQLFEWDGLLLFFHLMPQDIPQWQQVQENLRALLDSWDVRDAP